MRGWGGAVRGRDMCTPAVDTRYWDSCRQTRGESTSVQRHKHRHKHRHTETSSMVSAVITVVTVMMAGARAGADPDTCDSPLGLQSGAVSDAQLTASSSFTAAVGPSNARLGAERGGGAWCPAGLVTRDQEEQEWLQVELGGVYRITGLEVAGRWAGGVGREWSPGLSLAWHDAGRDLMVATSTVHPANTDTHSVVTVDLRAQNIVTDLLRVIPVSQHPRAVCLRLELRGCESTNTTNTTPAAAGTVAPPSPPAVQEEVTSAAQSPDDSRQELGGAAVAGPDSALFPALLTALAAVSTVLVLLTALLLRRLARGGKRVAGPAPATPGAAHYLQQQHTYSHHHQQQPAQLLKKNIYEVPRVEPIYSTPIEIFYPSSPSSLSTASSECEALQRPPTLASSTPRTQADTLDSYKSPRMQKFEDLVTFSPIYSYFSPAVEPKYSNIV